VTWPLDVAVCLEVVQYARRTVNAIVATTTAMGGVCVAQQARTDGVKGGGRGGGGSREGGGGGGGLVGSSLMVDQCDPFVWSLVEAGRSWGGGQDGSNGDDGADGKDGKDGKDGDREGSVCGSGWEGVGVAARGEHCVLVCVEAMLLLAQHRTSERAGEGAGERAGERAGNGGEGGKEAAGGEGAVVGQADLDITVDWRALVPAVLTRTGAARRSPCFASVLGTGGGAGEGGEGADGDVAATQADQGVLVTSRWKLVQVCTGEEKGEGREEEGGDEWTDKGLKECIVKE
jgi:hypothetical protein